MAIRLHNDFGIPVVGIPKTIDNDLMVTDFSFGFDTAVNIVTEAVDRLRTTTESHRRIMVVETMGRHSGWIACFAGIAVGADYILVPEVPIDLPHLIGVLSQRRAAGKKYGIVIVAEGAKFPDQGPLTLGDHPDPFGNPRLGGIGGVIAEAIEKQTGLETRSVALGHLQRGGPPSAYDRILATRLGLAAGRLVLQHRFGTIVTLAGGKIVESPLERELGRHQDPRPRLLRRGRGVLSLNGLCTINLPHRVDSDAIAKSHKKFTRGFDPAPNHGTMRSVRYRAPQTTAGASCNQRGLHRPMVSVDESDTSPPQVVCGSAGEAGAGPSPARGRSLTIRSIAFVSQYETR